MSTTQADTPEVAVKESEVHLSPLDFELWDEHQKSAIYIEGGELSHKLTLAIWNKDPDKRPVDLNALAEEPMQTLEKIKTLERVIALREFETVETRDQLDDLLNGNDPEGKLEKRIKKLDDDTKIAGATVTISAGLTAGDVLGFTNTANIISGTYDAQKGVLTLTGTDTVAAYQAALRSVTYSSTSEHPAAKSAIRSITWQVTDANSDGTGVQNSAVVSSTINLTALADAPVVTAGAVTDYTENCAAVVIDNTVTISDVDDTKIAGATVTISAGLTAGDALGFTNTANIISGTYDAQKGVLTLTGTDTVAAYQAALRSVTYSSTSEHPAAKRAIRSIAWQVTDANSGGTGVQNSAVVSSTINLTALANAPVVTAGAVTDYTENGAAVVIDNTVTISRANHDLNVLLRLKSKERIQRIHQMLDAFFGDNHHLKLLFPKGTLSAKASAWMIEDLDRLLARKEALGEDVWYIHYHDHPEKNFESLYLLFPTGKTLEAANVESEKPALEIVLPHIAVDAGNDALVLPVELRPGPLATATPDSNGLRGARICTVEVLSQLGQKYIPLHFDVVGSNTVLNDGTSTALLLRITNVDREVSIPIHRKGNRQTRFILACEIKDRSGHQEWALTDEKSKVKLWVHSASVGGAAAPNPDAKKDSQEWKKDWPGDPITASTNGRMAEWVVDRELLGTGMLKPNDSIYLCLEVQTGLRSGPTDLHLYYRHIPGYWDGSRSCTIQKSPLIFHHAGIDHDYVGIGTNVPPSKLAVTDGLTIGANWATTRQVSGKRVEGKKAPASGLLVEGNVGIGTHDPRSKLAVTDGLTIGAGWAHEHKAPTNGLLVKGSVWIGTTAPISEANLHVHQNSGTEKAALFVGGSGVEINSSSTEATLSVEQAGKGNAANLTGAVEIIQNGSKPALLVKQSKRDDLEDGWTLGVVSDDSFKISRLSKKAKRPVVIEAPLQVASVQTPGDQPLVIEAPVRNRNLRKNIYLERAAFDTPSKWHFLESNYYHTHNGEYFRDRWFFELHCDADVLIIVSIEDVYTATSRAQVDFSLCVDETYYKGIIRQAPYFYAKERRGTNLSQSMHHMLPLTKGEHFVQFMAKTNHGGATFSNVRTSIIQL